MGMMNVNLEGAVGQVRELRFMPDGTAALDVTVAVTPRKKTQDGDWTDMPTMWFVAKFWGRQAEKAAETIGVGTILALSGSLSKDEYERKDGGTGESWNIRVITWGIHPKLAAGSNQVAQTKDEEPAW